MEGFVKISPKELGNAMKMIGTEWMLITVKDEAQSRANAMTASWGAMGVLWNKNVAICFVRPQRHTYSLMANEERFSLALFGEGHREALALCGKESGRDCDKLALCGLSTSELSGVPVINEAETLLICRKLYEDDLREDCFLDKDMIKFYKDDYHTFYVCEIEEAYTRK